MPDETPVTAKSLREKARQIREQVERRVLELREAAEREAEKYERAAGAIEELETGLSPGPDSATIGTVPEGQTYRLVKRGLHRGPALRSRGPAATVAKRLGLSLRGLAEEMGISYEALKKQDARKSLTKDSELAMARVVKDHAKQPPGK